MKLEALTLRSLRARPVLLPLRRPIVARIATIAVWPLILIDLQTEEGIVGRAYLEPYLPQAIGAPFAAICRLRRPLDDRCCRSGHGRMGRVGARRRFAPRRPAGRHHGACARIQQ